ncbi:hypothetical protein EDB89DRAFT_1388462 [Lactarius sanguifluus]|nr:hypothetical protein EDB89DRAFT_1388462 [Lactarius sanguifluus]
MAMFPKFTLDAGDSVALGSASAVPNWMGYRSSPVTVSFVWAEASPRGVFIGSRENRIEGARVSQLKPWRAWRRLRLHCIRKGGPSQAIERIHAIPTHDTPRGDLNVLVAPRILNCSTPIAVLITVADPLFSRQPDIQTQASAFQLRLPCSHDSIDVHASSSAFGPTTLSSCHRLVSSTPAYTRRLDWV